jgi:hypothetical protein
VRVAVAHEAVELDERARIEELLDPLAREELAALALPGDRALVPGVERLLAQPRELGELVLGGRLGGGRRLLGVRHGREPRCPSAAATT